MLEVEGGWPAEAAGPTGVLPENRRLLEGRAGSEPGPYKKIGRIGHHLTWTQPGAKRGKRRTSLRPRTKTTSQAVANAAERPRKVRCQAHPAEEWQDLWALVQTSPRNLGEFGPCGQIRPQRLFSFGPCTARFLFSAQPKRGAPAGAQRSGSGGERRKERSLSGMFGFSRKWSGGVSSDFCATEKRGPRRSPAKRVRWGEEEGMERRSFFRRHGGALPSHHHG